MNPREQLRERLGVTQQDGPNSPKVTDEEILNVLRRAEDTYLTTTEVKEELPIGEQTSNRLTDLEEETRVTKRKTGQGYLWKLHQTEPKIEMNPRLGPVVRWGSKMRWWSQQIWENSKLVGFGGGLLIILALSAGLAEIAVPFVTWQIALAWGYITVIVAAAFIGFAWLLRLAAIGAPKAVERFLLE